MHIETRTTLDRRLSTGRSSAATPRADSRTTHDPTGLGGRLEHPATVECPANLEVVYFDGLLDVRGGPLAHLVTDPQPWTGPGEEPHRLAPYGKEGRTRRNRGTEERGTTDAPRHSGAARNTGVIRQPPRVGPKSSEAEAQHKVSLSTLNKGTGHNQLYVNSRRPAPSDSIP